MRPLATSRRLSTVCAPRRRVGAAGRALRPRLATALTPSRHRLCAFRAAGPRSVHPVAKERLKSPRVRLFVALDLPGPDSRRASRPGRRKALADPALRPMRAESLHVTLCFLGYHPEKALSRIAEAGLAGRPARPVELRFEAEPSARPKGRPRLYAIGAVSEAAVALQAELAEALEAERFYEPEKRAFWPHVTVARVRSERLPPERGERRGKGRPRRVTRRTEAAPRGAHQARSVPSEWLSTVPISSRRGPSTCPWRASTCRPLGDQKR